MSSVKSYDKVSEHPLEESYSKRWPRNWRDQGANYPLTAADEKIYYSRETAIAAKKREAALLWIGITIGAVVAFAIVYCAR